MDPQHLEELGVAKAALEQPGFAIRLANLLGWPIEKGLERLPAKVNRFVADLTNDALMAAMKAAFFTIPGNRKASYPWLHRLAAAASGVAGGAFGLAGLAFELPVSTTIICRSIAETALENGESLDDPVTRLACAEVFAMGGTSDKDDAANTSYFGIRMGLARLCSFIDFWTKGCG